MSRRRWDQEGLNLEGEKERAAEDLDREEVHNEEGTAQEEIKGQE